VQLDKKSRENKIDVRTHVFHFSTKLINEVKLSLTYFNKLHVNKNKKCMLS